MRNDYILFAKFVSLPAYSIDNNPVRLKGTQIIAKPKS